jgi:hypothetical protein
MPMPAEKRISPLASLGDAEARHILHIRGLSGSRMKREEMRERWSWSTPRGSDSAGGGLWHRCGGVVLCPTQLARRFERHVLRIDGWVSGLRDEKMRRCGVRRVDVLWIG